MVCRSQCKSYLDFHYVDKIYYPVRIHVRYESKIGDCVLKKWTIGWVIYYQDRYDRTFADWKNVSIGDDNDEMMYLWSW